MPVDEKARASFWLMGSSAAGLAVAIAGMVAAWPLMDGMERGFNPEWWMRSKVFFQILVSDFPRVLGLYNIWLWNAMAAQGYPPTAWIAVAVSALICGGRLARMNPHTFAATHLGKARWADRALLDREKLFSPSGIVLGQYSGKLIRNWETLSAMLIAPPGTGKTVQLVTNILADWPDRLGRRFLGVPVKWLFGTRKMPVPGPCMVINDPKGEIWGDTAGWRSLLGPVYKLAWGETTGAAWNFLSPMAYPGGERYLELRRDVLVTLGDIYVHPAIALNRVMKAMRDGGDSWLEGLIENPGQCGDLLDESVAADQIYGDLKPVLLELSQRLSNRESYIDRIVTILIPDSIEAHWRDTGREFLAGSVAFIMARSDHRGGEEATFGHLLDWMSGSLEEGETFDDFNYSPETVEAGQTVTSGKAAANDQLEQKYAAARQEAAAIRALQTEGGVAKKRKRKRMKTRIFWKPPLLRQGLTAIRNESSATWARRKESLPTNEDRSFPPPARPSPFSKTLPFERDRPTVPLSFPTSVESTAARLQFTMWCRLRTLTVLAGWWDYFLKAPQATLFHKLRKILEAAGHSFLSPTSSGPCRPCKA